MISLISMQLFSRWALKVPAGPGAPGPCSPELGSSRCDSASDSHPRALHHITRVSSWQSKSSTLGKDELRSTAPGCAAIPCNNSLPRKEGHSGSCLCHACISQVCLCKTPESMTQISTMLLLPHVHTVPGPQETTTESWWVVWESRAKLMKWPCLQEPGDVTESPVHQSPATFAN